MECNIIWSFNDYLKNKMHFKLEILVIRLQKKDRVYNIRIFPYWFWLPKLI